MATTNLPNRKFRVYVYTHSNEIPLLPLILKQIFVGYRILIVLYYYLLKASLYK